LASLSQPGVSQTRVAISVAAILTGASAYLPLRIELSPLLLQSKHWASSLSGIHTDKTVQLNQMILNVFVKKW